MLKQKKEWAAGEVFDVRGCKKGETWKLVGESGTHHCTVRRADYGKAWKWAPGAVWPLDQVSPQAGKPED